MLMHFSGLNVNDSTVFVISGQNVITCSTFKTTFFSTDIMDLSYFLASCYQQFDSIFHHPINFDLQDNEILKSFLLHFWKKLRTDDNIVKTILSQTLYWRCHFVKKNFAPEYLWIVYIYRNMHVHDVFAVYMEMVMESSKICTRGCHLNTH